MAKLGVVPISNGKALRGCVQLCNGIVTYRGVMRSIVTKNSDGQAWYSIGKAWYSIGKALRITARACKGKALSRLQS